MHQTLESRFVHREREREREADLVVLAEEHRQSKDLRYRCHVQWRWCARGHPSIRMAEAALLTLIVGLSMSKICPSYRIADGLYFWSANLCVNE
ncbi:hypothetical protein HanXRQr2_Chr05g0234771 [Helianthus annuus]|uniref:Uncharacterized protein n=1 Tax=Helianthus annuus TaxID=4232 RepID=A0A251UT87_HELAN|nr:hypothetical protein HanXRQr2_Chr05g0234771 [Helianthus annuus]KAJ0924292.1 hypothetical protein HanPSC8_Chr05g0226541 [Helianthus annuus]